MIALDAMDTIAVSGLTKTYGRIAALRRVTLAVPQGTLFGLLGPNGAGKSTLIKAVVGVLRPSAGTVRVLDLDPLRDAAEVRRQIGYMPQSPALYDDLSARDNVTFFGRAHSMPAPQRRIDAVLELTDLAARAADPVHTFSGGMQRRVSLACALVHGPRVLFLDEPTAAVDPYLRARLWQTFRDLAATGVTLFISTHLMDEALLCDRVAVLRGGRVIVCDTPRGLLTRGRTRLTVQRDGRTEEVEIGGHPEDLAAALHRYGLATDVSAVDIAADSLETVILRLIDTEVQHDADADRGAAGRQAVVP
jgi:ABC-2 type transport system ATP-binding protein